MSRRDKRSGSKRKAGTKARARGQARSWRRILAALALRGLTIIVVLGGGYVAMLDVTVRNRFDGQRWQVSARVFARPLEIYEGRSLDRAALDVELRSAGYAKVATAGRAGHYSVKATRGGVEYRIRTRSFQFWDGAEPERDLRVVLNGHRVTRLVDGERAAGLARLEPAVIGQLFPGHSEDRILIGLDDVPDALLFALLISEDRSFFRHHGISIRGIARAALTNILAAAPLQGGSTLTQQLAKSYFLTNARTVWRKFNDVLIALIIEARYDKSDILETYLNEIYLGQDGARAIHGFGLAAQFYFGRPVQELSPGEAALLVALVRGPSYYHPRRHPERARERRNLILELMADHGYPDSAALESAKAAPLGLRAEGGGSGRGFPAYLELVRRQLRSDFLESDLRADGLSIYTNLVPFVQQVTEASIIEGVAALAKRRGLEAVQAAAVVAEPASGDVLAVVGDASVRAAGFNRALDARRPVGSLLKPLIYASAFDADPAMNLASPVLDEPLELTGRDGKRWSPKNFDGESHGEVPLIRALANSYNQAAVRVGLAVGVHRVLAKLEESGIHAPVDRYPAALLGAAPLSPLEVTQLYQMLANGGFASPLNAIRAVTTADGKALKRYPLKSAAVLSPESATLITRGLQEVTLSGTARAVLGAPGIEGLPAAKTGTSNGNRDSWLAGYGQDRVIVVWVGLDDNLRTGLTGSSGALPIWRRIASATRLKAPSLEWGEVEWLWADLATGTIRAGECDGAVELPFKRSAIPPQRECIWPLARSESAEPSGNRPGDSPRTGPGDGARDSDGPTFESVIESLVSDR